MNVDANDLVESLKLQREVQATEAAMMDAACKGLKRELAAALARIAELEKPKTKRKASGQAT